MGWSRRNRIGLWLGVLVTLAVGGAGAWATWLATQTSRVPIYGVEIVKVYPHDLNAFTQGLEFSGGQLYEGTGQYGRSRLRKVQLETGTVLKEAALPDEIFGEGITIWKDRILQLSWQERTGLIFDKETFELRGRFRYAGEGWGLTHDNQHLIMSDGTATLRFLDPESYKPVRSLRVATPEGRPVDQLNELEYINGEILANIWNTTTIARISARSGRIVGWIDASNVRPRQAIGSNAVLNGIAYEPKSQRLFVTGKNWSDLFEIRIVPRP
ncbi:glutaminyl-peptide cyclotransferase [Tautonia sp. JC769]|uniref:glutaminyl-peptide cyclotransferase n=1 Tax=Tautonia sp. JC769 TaxID=3232135 RepID=UPI0034586217